MKTNCWEFKKCGRERGGAKSHELGVCIAFENAKLDGMHGGKNGGRACWVVTGTLCGGTKQGSFVTKMSNCMKCEFYKQVIKEEGSGLKKSSDLMALVK